MPPGWELSHGLGGRASKGPPALIIPGPPGTPLSRATVNYGPPLKYSQAQPPSPQPVGRRNSWQCLEHFRRAHPRRFLSMVNTTGSGGVGPMTAAEGWLTCHTATSGCVACRTLACAAGAQDTSQTDLYLLSQPWGTSIHLTFNVTQYATVWPAFIPSRHQI
ncbi:hypothetical protein SRHO_G00169330 [Serrasalmus rhombeus]